MAVMACVVQAGEDTALQNETHPIIYIEMCGAYKCVVEVGDASTKEYLFIVQGSYHRDLLLHLMTCHRVIIIYCM